MQEKSARPYHHGDLKRVVIETAQAMLREDKGWQFTLREVARRAGVSHAAPYKHFPDKSALLAELATLGFNQLGEAIAERLRRPLRSARAEFIVAAKAYIHFGTANPSLYRLMFSADVDKTAFAESGCGRRWPRLQVCSASWSAARGAARSNSNRCAARLRPHGHSCMASRCCAIDGQLLPEKVGAKPIDAVLTSMLEGLES